MRELADRTSSSPASARHPALQARHHARRDLRGGRPARSARRCTCASAQRCSAAVPRGGEEEALEALAYHYGAGGEAAQAAHYAELRRRQGDGRLGARPARTQYRAALAALERGVWQRERALRWVDIVQRLAWCACSIPSAARSNWPNARWHWPSATRSAARGAGAALAGLHELRIGRPACGDRARRTRAARGRAGGRRAAGGAGDCHAGRGAYRGRPLRARARTAGAGDRRSSAATAAAGARRRAWRTRWSAVASCWATAAGSQRQPSASTRRWTPSSA